jgi:membrane-associated protein
MGRLGSFPGHPLFRKALLRGIIRSVDGFISSLDPWLIYVLVALLTFGESAAFISLVFPGEVALVAAAALGLSAGVDPFLLAGVATIGALAGGLFGYAIGRRYGPRLMRWGPLSRRLGDRMTQLRPLLTGPEAGPLVAVARFNQITRAVVPALAGMAEMGRVRFAIANGVGALIWASVFTAIGFYAAEWWHSTSQFVHLVMGGVIVLGIGGWWITRRRKRVAGTTTAEVSRPES